MSIAPKTDYSGLARTGLEVAGNEQSASNQNLEIPGSNGDIIGGEVFGHVKAPHVDFKITKAVTIGGSAAENRVTLGKVYKAGSAFALKTVSIHTGAGDEPTFGVDLVQIESGATQTVCTYDLPEIELSPARHALTFGAFAFTESATLALQTSDYTATCELDPTTIDGVPRASDAVKGKIEVAVTFWTADDTTTPNVTMATGWTQTGDWNCTGADSSMFVWTATFTKYLTATVPAS